MLVIRKEQMDVLERGTNAAFEERMVLHLRRSFAVKCDELGDTGVLRRIRAGAAKAASFGIVTQRDVARYINLMFTHGEGFDADPALPWDIIDGGMKASFFRSEFTKALNEEWTLPVKRQPENARLMPVP